MMNTDPARVSVSPSLPRIKPRTCTTRPRLAAPTHHAAELLTLSSIASASGHTASRAQDALKVIHEIVPYDAAKISRYDPLEDTHRTIANHGYPPDVASYLDEGFVERDELYKLMRSDGAAPLRWADTPFNYRESESVTEVFEPAGFDEGFSVCLYTPDNRYTGALHISVGDRSGVGDSVIHAALWMQHLLSPLTDRLAPISELTRAMGPGISAVLLNQNGDVHPLPTEDTPGNVLPAALVTILQGRWRELRTRRAGRWLWRDLDDRWLRIQTLTIAGDLLVMVGNVTPPHSLTARELQIITAVARGDTNTRIGRTLKLSPRTVAKHLENILGKTGVASRTELAVSAVEEGFTLLD